MVKKIESAIQKALIHWVKDTYGDAVIITATANERSYRETDQIGCIGIQDLLLFKAGISVLFLELKKKKGKLSASQLIWNQEFDTKWQCHNAKRAVAYGFSEAKGIIIEWMNQR